MEGNLPVLIILTEPDSYRKRTRATRHSVPKLPSWCSVPGARVRDPEYYKSIQIATSGNTSQDAILAIFTRTNGLCANDRKPTPRSRGKSCGSDKSRFYVGRSWRRPEGVLVERRAGSVTLLKQRSPVLSSSFLLSSSSLLPIVYPSLSLSVVFGSFF